MADRYSAVSALSFLSDERTIAKSSSRHDSFSRTLLRPWSFAQDSIVSELGDNLESNRTEDGFDSSHLDRPPTYKSTGAWARIGHADREKGDEKNGFATGRSGWWKEQMLVDRSLRSMAALTSLFALIMFIICIKYLPELLSRHNETSTSVGSNSGQSCEHLEGTNVFLHLLINVAATMILGMSNTYQQLVTSLRVDEIRWALSMHGDSRVGTNSPLNIKHKKTGKRKAWLSWLLLILTSLPIHLLVNSVFGQSVFVASPSIVQYTPVQDLSLTGGYTDWPCWVAFRTGEFPSLEYAPPVEDTEDAEDLLYSDYFGASILLIRYQEAECGRYRNSSTIAELDPSQEIPPSASYSGYRIEDCSLRDNVECEAQGYEPKCRISVRMSAALTLAICLIIKATYMIIINVSSRHSIKSQCLTFGDVIVASAMDPDLRIRNECMVNAGDGYRHKVAHTCHKHCKDHEVSPTGDSIGHCQKCAKFNTSDKAANLVHPSIAIKYKKSLLSNLGSTALVQMIILMFCSIAMLGVSIFLACSFAASLQNFRYECNTYDKGRAQCTDDGEALYLKELYGTWGGFNSSASVGGASVIRSEGVAFLIANAAQFLYSGIYLLLTYNVTLISMELDWGRLETARNRLRCTLVRGSGFNQSYLLQLPKKVLFPMMIFSSVMHWLLGQAISARETVFADPRTLVKRSEQSVYSVVYGTYSVWVSTVLMMAMTATCWWAFTYTREGFMPTMFGSIRACCAATTELEEFPDEGIQWGDLGQGEKFRHAGFSEDKVGPITPGELYCGRR